MRVMTILAAVLAASPALAAHIVVNPVVAEVASSTQTGGSGNAPPGGAFVTFRNGAIVGTPGITNAGTFDVSSNPGGTTVGAATTGTNTVLGFGGGGSASASLERGELKTAASGSLSNPSFSLSNEHRAQLQDTIHFTNSSSDWVTLPFSFRVTGLMDHSQVFFDSLASIWLTSTGASANALGQVVGPAIDSFGYGNRQNAIFRQDTGVSSFQQAGGGALSTAWTATKGENDGIGGQIDFTFSTLLHIPTGLTSLGLFAELHVFCNGAGACDFGNTGKIRFGDLPDGLSFGSASGVFLSGLSPIVPAVPEPASWALMFAGFGLVGAAARRPRSTGRSRSSNA